MITRVISGGQTGADQGGLRAARSAGILTGGTMPRGFRTLDGPRPDLAELYGMVEHTSPEYPPRTADNVKNSDATLRFAEDFETAGEICTLKAIKRFKKEHFDIDIYAQPAHQALANWLYDRKIAVLNVAGNSEKNSPGISDFVAEYLFVVIKLIQSYK